MSQEYMFEYPDRFIVGTVGLPGERTFYLQISSISETIFIRLEKQQASVIGMQLESLLDDNFQSEYDQGRRAKASDLAPLNLPITDSYDLIGVGFLLSDETVQIKLTATSDVAEDNIEIEVYLDRNRAREFCARTRSVVAAGRAICPFCSLPLDVNGHLCARSNGYRR